MAYHPLLTPFRLGNLDLPNRVIMAPLTRRRAGKTGLPTRIMETYYRQRAGAGLIITEATQISLQATGYVKTPGMYTPAMIQAWKRITTAIHQSGGRVFIQLWHVGRLSHPAFLNKGDWPVAPSPLVEPARILTPAGYQDLVVPRALEVEEIGELVRQFGKAAANAMEAGFDGVEIHGANGYLIDQFLRDGSNHRTDAYGGSIPNRVRFLLEVTREVTQTIGPERTGVRLSPSGVRHGMVDSDPIALFQYAITALNEFRLAYLHLLEPLLPLDEFPQFPREVTRLFRPICRLPLITNGGYNLESANRMIQEGLADLVSFGKAFISNPDLCERFEIGHPLQDWDPETFYTGGRKGYTDYPAMPKGPEFTRK